MRRQGRDNKSDRLIIFPRATRYTTRNTTCGRRARHGPRVSPVSKLKAQRSPCKSGASGAKSRISTSHLREWRDVTRACAAAEK